jgi:uncharacterized membrane protein YtjA (UPF0391 family)
MLRTTMGLGVLFVVIALVAGLFGFGYVSANSWAAARIFFFIFLVLAVLSFLGGFLYSRRST